MANQVITATQNDSNGVVNYASGSLVGDAGTPVAYELILGFSPRYFRLVSLSGTGAPIQYEMLDGMAAGNTIKTVAAGTVTVDTTDVFTVTDRSIIIPASVLLASASYAYEARA